jgi:hypothetical protein
MALFTDTDLQGFSDLAQDLALKDTCDILRETDGADDGSGGNTPTWPAALTAIPCLVVDGGRKPQEQILAMKLVGKVMKTIMLPRQTDVKNTDRISVTSGNSLNTAIYHVVEPEDPTTYEVLRRVTVWREK